MKKYVALILAFSLTLALAGCGGKDDAADDAGNNVVDDNESNVSDDTENNVTDDEGNDDADDAGSDVADDAENNDVDDAGSDTESDGVMTYAEYMAAAVDEQVVVETYVQAKQSWWDDKATVYTQDEDGAYFIYNMACSEEDYGKLTQGTKIKVTGYKAEWSGEIEIVDATFEIVDGNYVAAALDVTDLLGTDDLIAHQNEFVSFKGMTVEDAGNGEAFMYKWDNSGSDGDDLYFNVSLNGQTYTFTVESYLL